MDKLKVEGTITASTDLNYTKGTAQNRNFYPPALILNLSIGHRSLILINDISYFPPPVPADMEVVIYISATIILMVHGQRR